MTSRRTLRTAYSFPPLVSEVLLRSTMTTASRVLWRPRLEGREHFPVKGPCFVYGNHSNRWDPFIINCFTRPGRPTAGVMTREFFRNKFLAGVFGGVGVLPTRKRIAEPFLVRRVLELLQDDRIVLIFPEGGSRWNGRPLPWMRSTVKMFPRAGVPVHPLRLHGSYASFPRWADYPRPAKVVVEARPPRILDRAAPLERCIRDLYAETDFDDGDLAKAYRPTRAYRPAAGIHRLLYRNPWDGGGALYTDDGWIVHTGSGTMRMRPDSTLVDRDGREHRSADLYAMVRALPVEPDKGGVVLSDDVDLSVERQFPDLEPYGAAIATLYPDRIAVRSNTFDRTIELDRVGYCDIERNNKLQLYLADGSESMMQFTFARLGSPLQWKDALERIRPEMVEPGLRKE